MQGDLFALLTAAPVPDIERERRLRIRVALAAYAYEIEASPIMSDVAFDALARRINPAICTGNAVFDRFFREEFAPHTGSWIHRHPGLDRLRQIYRTFSANT